MPPANKNEKTAGFLCSTDLNETADPLLRLILEEKKLPHQPSSQPAVEKDIQLKKLINKIIVINEINGSVHMFHLFIQSRS